MKKISFISILRTIAYLKNNVMSDLLKKYKFTIDAEESVINVFLKKAFDENRTRPAHMKTSPSYEIEVRQRRTSKRNAQVKTYSNSFTLVDLFARYDSDTGLYDERFFKTVTTILEVFSQLIEEELNNFQEYQCELADRRRDRAEELSEEL